uniref:Heat shock protein 70 n=1 Tax=Panagrolaimus sp. ES5 TaxID=591445 RepID=A0AC34FKM1_9BILA
MCDCISRPIVVQKIFDLIERNADIGIILMPNHNLKDQLNIEHRKLLLLHDEWERLCAQQNASPLNSSVKDKQVSATLVAKEAALVRQQGIVRALLDGSISQQSVSNKEDGLNSRHVYESVTNLNLPSPVPRNLNFFKLNVFKSPPPPPLPRRNSTFNKTLPAPPPRLPVRITSLNSGIYYAIPQKDTLVTSTFRAIGIDLGTSRCCVAVNKKNGITAMPLDNTGERLLPSYISYNEENVKCGRIVINQLRHFSKSTIFDSKRIIGRDFNEIEIDESWNFKVCNENQKVKLKVDGFNGTLTKTAEEVAADFLKYMKQKAQEFQGEIISKVVITVPAAFTDFQKAATISATNLAGWNEVKLLPEPIAAAFAYFNNQSIPNKSTVLLFDLGGGTLDVCIFKVENDMINILSNTGDTKLGGRNFDTVLINYFKNILNTNYGIAVKEEKKYKLMSESQRIKEDLTSILSCSLDVDEFDTTKEGYISITRAEFQRMTQPLLNKIRNTIQSALFKSKLEEDQINQILHVGGGSRMPMVKALLKEMFPNAEHCIEEHPDEVVAIGAAYYAYSIFSN